MPTATSMPTAASILADLKSKGKESTRKIYARHGMDPARVYGVSVAELKLIAKTIKKQQTLALELYATGIMDAMYLAGMVANGAQMTRAQLNAWAEGAAGLQMIAEPPSPGSPSKAPTVANSPSSGSSPRRNKSPPPAGIPSRASSPPSPTPLSTSRKSNPSSIR
jgi:hypothetical protein